MSAGAAAGTITHLLRERDVKDSAAFRGLHIDELRQNTRMCAMLLSTVVSSVKEIKADEAEEELANDDELMEKLLNGILAADFTETRTHVLKASAIAEQAFEQQSDDDVLDTQIMPLINQLSSHLVPESILDAYETRCWDASDAVHPMSQGARDLIRELKIPLVMNRPSLLLHEIGEMDAIDPQLEQRIDHIFNGDGILVNTSGAGKTRLILEGLCRFWGLYFVTIKQGDRSSSALGSIDLHTAIDEHIPRDKTRDGRGFTEELGSDDTQPSQNTDALVMSQSTIQSPPPDPPGSAGLEISAALKANRKIAEKRFSDVLLARLMIFRRFLAQAWERLDVLQREGKVADTEAYWQKCKKAWLLVQLQSSYLRFAAISDPFAELSARLNHLSADRVKKLLYATIKAIQPFHVHPLTGELERRFIVIDEAQYAAEKWSHAFRCKNDLLERPVFREIIFNWGKLLDGQDEFYIVCAGSALNAAIAHESFTSAHGKEYASGLYLTRVGEFHDAEYIERYTRRFLPAGYAETEYGARLLRRLAIWLRGRPRLTASFVTDLMKNGYAHGHEVLNSYITKFSDLPDFMLNPGGPQPPDDDVDLIHGFYPSDSSKFRTVAEVKISTRVYPWNVEVIHSQYPHMLATLLSIVIAIMVRSKLPPPGTIGLDEALFVQQGIAWFDAHGHAIVDEPLILLNIGRWFDRQKHLVPQRVPSFHSTYWQVAHNVRITDPRHNGFEEYLALCLVDFIFAKPRRLSDVLHFCGSQTPSFADWDASLVGMYKPGPGDSIDVGVYEHSRLRRPSFSFGVESNTFDDMLAWMRHEVGYQAIMFPDKALGPDLLCKLRLEKADVTRYVWLAIQAKARLYVDGAHAVKSVTPEMFHSGSAEKELKQQHIYEYRQALQELPDRHLDAGPYSVLRVVASYPFNLELTERKLRGTDFWDTGKHGPLATMNMDLIESLTKNLSPTDVLSNWRKQQDWAVDGIEERKRNVHATAEEDRGKRAKVVEPPSGGSTSTALGSVPESKGEGRALASS